MKRTLLTIAVCALMTAPALAHITIPWDTNPYGTYQKWTFGTAPPIYNEGLGEVPPWIRYLADPEVDNNPYTPSPFAYIYLEGSAVPPPAPGW
ncbi:MAG: hypothetical protein NTX52_00805, partial [Planctomycetota bacterium]|nr:hypothetical protein [Planctomycetota bacterium]